jgi:pSer/pThr/pTyr-binding forkhead associated (FHA) protein
MDTRARLSFPSGEHRDVPLGPGAYTLGTAADNQVVLVGAGISQRHARIENDGRGLTLTVLDSQAITHVNARPIREKALLRLGDSVTIDTVRILIKPERDDVVRTTIPDAAKELDNPETRVRAVPPKAVLRGVSGSHFGKIIPIRVRLTIGRGSECDLVLDEPEMSRKHAMIENSGDGLYLRDLGSANGTFVNGVQVKNAVLHPGDQLAFDRNRFLVEAPGLPMRGEEETDPAQPKAPMITQMMQAVDVPDPVNPARKPAPQPAQAPSSSRNEIWWLIGAAALIGAGIALLLLVKF